ncbi:HU family DNA-binding protein [Mycolicibacterium agri]|uniref:DNA-binding protein HupB n=1 Tax=Mycolicibacterium agri TaxID=36811 RepID=A0A7I9VX71_MYCAG|nr:HU family DNA-binding protein [Mycolicibacterium agri]GFG49870.1 DNA-binding protein HU [Mycolicibacterium agri]
MNKAELIDVLTKKLDIDRRSATDAVENIVDTIVRAVHKGDSVTITGFGVFEQRRRAARVARNPRTGETVKVKPTNVPAFRPGAQFKAVVSGAQRLPAEGPAVKRGSGTGTARKAAKRSAAKKAVKRSAAKKAVKRSAAKKAVKRSAAKKAVKRSAAKKAVKRTAAKKATKRTAAKKATKRAGAKKATKRAGAKKVAKRTPAKKVAKRSPAKKGRR